MSIRGFALVGLFGSVIGCASHEEGLGQSAQGAAPTSSLTNRWYGANDSNRLTVYIHPSVSDVDESATEVSHKKAIELMRDNLNRLTALDVVIKDWGDNGPDLNDEEPHLVFVESTIPPNRTYSYSSLKNAVDAGNEPESSFWDEFDGFPFLRKSDGTGANFRHDDYVIKLNVGETETVETGRGGDSTSTALHETGHALGLNHEQKRPDACYYLKLYECCGSSETAFDTIDEDNISLLSPYDFDSIMQYSSTSMCNKNDAGNCICYPLLKRPAPIDECLTPSCPSDLTTSDQTGDQIEKKGYLSAEDVNVLYQMYPRKSGDDEDGDEFGDAIARGDFDGDGYDDLAVGAPGEAYGDDPASGVVYLFKGTYTGLMPWNVLKEPSPADGDRFGSALQAADVDSDGKAELLVGAPHRKLDGVEAGAVWVFEGSFIGPKNGEKLTPANTGFDAASEDLDRFGGALAKGDFDGDGAPEIAIGAPGKSRVYIVRWKNAAFEKYRLLGVERDKKERFGKSLATGDLDADGLDDLVIGAPSNVDFDQAGKVFIAISKKSSSKKKAGTFTVSRLNEPVDQPKADDQFGEAVAVGKFNPDTSYAYVAVGAPGRNNGRVFVIRGPNPTAANKTVITLEPADFGLSADGDEFGESLEVRDFRGGGQDLVVGASHRHNDGGLVALYRGRLDSSDAVLNPALVYDDIGGLSFGSGVRFGNALAPGDYNHDGHPDLAVAAVGFDGVGRVFVARGQAGAFPEFELASSPTFTGFLSQGSNGAGTLSDPGGLDSYRR